MRKDFSSILLSVNLKKYSTMKVLSNILNLLNLNLGNSVIFFNLQTGWKEAVIQDGKSMKEKGCFAFVCVFVFFKKQMLPPIWKIFQSFGTVAQV